MVTFIRKLFSQKSNSFIRKVIVNVLMLATTFAIIVTGITIHYRANSFRNQKRQIRHSILSVKMNAIQQETMTAYRYIQYARKQYYDKIIADLKKKLNHDYKRLEYVHSNTSSKQEAIANLQQYYTFEQKNHDRNFFINSLDGKALVNFSNPQAVGAVVSDLIDYRGNTVVKNELRTLQDQKEALLKYQLENNDTSLFSRKVVLLKKYTPLNLYIGEVIYLEDFTSDLKNYIIDMLAKIRFGEEGYLFVNTTAGYALIKDGEIVEDPVNIWNLTDPNGVKVIQQEYKAAQKPNGDYIYYSWRKLNSDKIAKKVSYVRGVEAFDWMIGAGTYLDDINNRIAQAEKGLYNNMLRDVLLLAGIFIVLLIAGYYIVKRYVVAEQEQLKLFTDYFKRRGFDNQLLDTSHIYYSEFKTMSEAVNSMMKKNREMTGQIKNDRLLLRYLVDAIPDSITYKNTNFEYVGCNKAFEKTFGISLERMKYKKVADLFEPEVVTVIEEMEAELFRQRQPIRRMVWIKDRDNTNIRMEVTKTFYYDQNENILGIITINRPYYLEKETATS